MFNTKSLRTHNRWFLGDIKITAFSSTTKRSIKIKKSTNRDLSYFPRVVNDEFRQRYLVARKVFNIFVN